MEYNLNRPWLTLDEWQKEYAFRTGPDQNCFLLCGRQTGKTTAMSIKAVELAVNQFKEGEYILICSITEKQAYHMLAKALAYASEKYPSEIDRSKENKPTMHRIIFENGTGILCYASGETGEGLRGYTIKKLMIDEGSRMNNEFFMAVSPMLSVVGGSMDVGSTPAGKIDKEGNEKFFYKCSQDPKFKKFYVSAENCPRTDKEFLEAEKGRLSKLMYAQEYLALFTDELKRLFDDDIIKKACELKRTPSLYKNGKFYLGVDVAGLGSDECSFEVMERLEDKRIMQRESMTEKRNFTTDTTRKILQLNSAYKFMKIGVDDGGVGFGVFSELMNTDATKRKVEALNNSARAINYEGTKSVKLLKEDMYFNLLSLMENNRIKLLDDDEIKASLASIQHEDGKIFGSYSHIAEGIIRAAWLAEKDKSLKVFAHSF